MARAIIQNILLNAQTHAGQQTVFHLPSWNMMWQLSLHHCFHSNFSINLTASEHWNMHLEKNQKTSKGIELQKVWQNTVIIELHYENKEELRENRKSYVCLWMCFKKGTFYVVTNFTVLRTSQPCFGVKGTKHDGVRFLWCFVQW